MAQKIRSESIGFVRNVEFSINVPELLATLVVSEEHVKHIQAIQVLATFLDKIARQSIEINNSDLLAIMFRMKLLKVTEEGDHYEDI